MLMGKVSVLLQILSGWMDKISRLKKSVLFFCSEKIRTYYDFDLLNI